MKVGICIVLYDDLQHISRLSDSIAALTHTDRTIYFLDNSVLKVHRAEMRKRFHDAQEVTSVENCGFAAGNNLLAKKAIDDACNAIWILNPDMAPTPDSLSLLVNVLASDQRIAAVGPVVCYGETESNPIIQLAGVDVDFKTQKKQNRLSDKSIESLKSKEPLRVDSLNGGSVLIRSDWSKNEVLFEEKYFMYNDEIDLMRRIHKSGSEVFVCPDALVFHYHDWTKNNASGHCRMYYYMTRNKYLYWLKFRNYLQFAIGAMKDIVLFPIIARFCYRTAGFILIKYYYLGVLHGCLGKSGKVEFKFY